MKSFSAMSTMDSFAGVFDRIYKETYNLISSRKKIFIQIIMAFILISLAHKFQSHSFSNVYTVTVKTGTLDITYKFDVSPGYYIVLIITSLSTSACIYTISCIYTGRDELLTFEKVMALEVWKRLFITLLCSSLVLFAYFALATPYLTGFGPILDPKIGHPVPVIWTCHVAIGIAKLALVGTFLYVIVVCEFAKVVSVVQESCGFEALRKSKQMLKGQIMWVVMLTYCLRLAIKTRVVENKIGLFSSSFTNKVSYWVISLILFDVLRLVCFVVLTIIYFVSKTDEHEDVVDHKVAVSDQRQIYVVGAGEYNPLIEDDHA